MSYFEHKLILLWKWDTAFPGTHTLSMHTCCQLSALNPLCFFPQDLFSAGKQLFPALFRDKPFLSFNPLGPWKWQSSRRWEWKSVPAFVQLLSAGSRSYTPRCTDKAQTALHYQLSAPPGSVEGVVMYRAKRVWFDFDTACTFRVGNWNLSSPQVEECYAERMETWLVHTEQEHLLLADVELHLSFKIIKRIFALPEQTTFADWTDSKAKKVTASGHCCCVKQSSSNENCFAFN